jgi:foldase protein PrsA
MKKGQVLKAIVILQAICMIVLSVVVIARLAPDKAKTPPQGVGRPAPSDVDAPDANDGDSEQTAAKIGGLLITVQDVQEELKRQFGASVLRTMLVREAIRLEAETTRLDVTPSEMQDELASMMEGYGDEESFYSSMQEQLGMSRDDVQEDTRYRLLLEKIAIRAVDVTESDVDRYMEEHPEEFNPTTELAFSWIVTETEADGKSVIGMLDQGEPFEQLARAYSIDAYTADTGGWYGTVDLHDPYTDGAILAALAELEVGMTAGPIEADAGWAIVRLESRETTEQMDGRRQRERVKKMLALAEAPSLRQVEEELLAKYGAEVSDDSWSP